MIITDLSHFDNLCERKVAIRGGHSYSKSYSFQSSYSSSYHPSSKYGKYVKHFDVSKYSDASVYSKYADYYGKYTVTKASAYKHGANSSSYSVDYAYAH